MRGQILLVLGILALGGVIAAGLILSRPEPPREERAVIRPAVEVFVTETRDVPVTITGYGTVQAVMQSQIVPEVSGRVQSVHPNLSSGGFIPAGEALVLIDPSDYELAVADARAQLGQARASVAAVEAQMEESNTSLREATKDMERTHQLYERGVLSRRDADQAEAAWQMARATIQRLEAERETAVARLGAVEVNVRKAELNLRRTRLTFPFNAVVLREQVGSGQFVMAGQSVGEVYGPSALEIPVPLEAEELRWLPALVGLSRGNGNGTVPQSALPAVDVAARLAGRELQWEGRVVRMEGEIDVRSRTVGVVVRVRDSQEAAPRQIALRPGTFVTVQIHGPTLEDVVPVPAYALHAQDEVWVVEDGRLRVRRVEVARRERDWVYLSSGVEPGEQVVITPMDIVTDGMEVQVASSRTPGDTK